MDAATLRLKKLREKTPKWVKRTCLTLVVALLGVLLGTQLGGHGSYRIGPFDVQMSLKAAIHGETKVEVPPLGALRVNTHKGPTVLSAQVGQLDPARAQNLVEHPEKIEQSSDDALDQLKSALGKLLVKTIIISLITSIILGLLFFRQLGQALLTGGMAIVILASVLGLAWTTFRPASIREPHYEGLLTNVPSVIGDAETLADSFPKYQADLVKLVRNMSHVYTNISNLSDYKPDPNTTRVLHVTDFHLNPTAFEVINTIAQQFRVDVIVDTGDITDWGSEQENKYIVENYVSKIKDLNIPYIFIRGNHDSRATAEAIAKQSNAIVLENSIKEVAGLTFAGIGDPRHAPDKDGADLVKEEDKVIEKSEQLSKTIKNYNQVSDNDIDVGLIHDPAGIRPLAGKVPLVLAGHIHKRKVSHIKGTMLKIEGSTGARGLRGLYENETSPINMGMLYFDKESGQLRAYDEITVGGIGQSKVELQRTMVT